MPAHFRRRGLPAPSMQWPVAPVGQGSQVQVTADVAKLGTNILMLRPGGRGMQPGPGGGTSVARPFNLRMVARLERGLVEIETAAPVSNGAATVVAGGENYRTQITATDARYLAGAVGITRRQTGPDFPALELLVRLARDAVSRGEIF